MVTCSLSTVHSEPRKQERGGGHVALGEEAVYDVFELGGGGAGGEERAAALAHPRPRLAHPCLLSPPQLRLPAPEGHTHRG
eukprot:3255747-Rhodomonas_salina.1